MARIELSLFIAAPPARCFDLSRSVEAHLHSTAATGEVAVAGKTSGLLTLGDRVTWRARHFGVWQELTSELTAFERPVHFRDSLVRGAFARFDHDHYFAPSGVGTVVRDVFDYRAPFGILGRAAEWLFLTAYMRHFLGIRLHALKVVAESGEWVKFLPSEA